MILKFIKSSYENVKQALSKTGSLIGTQIRSLFKGPVDDATLDRLEQLLYESDLGADYAQELTEKVRKMLKDSPDISNDSIVQAIKNEILSGLNKLHNIPMDYPTNIPHVILIIGVNGNGKTTSLAKLANLYQNEKKKVVIGAADTFRAAAMEQLEVWAHRLNVDIVKGNSKSDPAAVVFDAISAGQARGADIVLIDTAGRLHTKISLMQELEKIRRTCKKVIPDSPHETFLVLDATTGQNGIDQAKTFHKYTPITGLILTKLDGTAKGGGAIAIQRKLGIPIRFIGVGEGVDDLRPFDAESFVDALFD